MEIGILAIDDDSNPLQKKWGSYCHMLKRLVSQAGVNLSCKCYDVARLHLPNSVDECEGWLISGSRHSVYDNLPWIKPLQEFIYEAFVAGKAVVGICFGHQLLSQALGGRVERSEKGWGIGWQQYWASGGESWIKGAPRQISCLAVHQDQIVELAPGARVLYGSEFCPYAMLAYDGNSRDSLPQALSLQAHPEFLPGYIADLMQMKKEQYSAEKVKQAKKELYNPVDTRLIANWIGKIFYRHNKIDRSVVELISHSAGDGKCAQ